MCKVEDVGHHFVGGHEVICVEGVDDTLLCLSERTVVGYATQHEHAQIVGLDGCRTINYLADFIVVIERLPHEVDVVGQSMSMRLPN
jgi:hypothetical protein